MVASPGLSDRILDVSEFTELQYFCSKLGFLITLVP